jgi:hypothetical protein
MTSPATKSNKTYRIRYSLVAALAAVAAVCSFFRAYEEDVNLLTRQAAISIQEYVPFSANDDGEQVSCRLLHTSKLSTKVVIDKSAVRAQSKDILDKLKQFTHENYEKYLMDNPGKEHYSLWHYLTKNYHASDDCRHVVDIGTRYVASALALGATGVPVKTFDIPESKERRAAFRGKTEEEWQVQLTGSTVVQVEFKNLDLLAIPDAEFREYMSTWLIILDTFHLPYTVPFEIEYLSRLTSMEPKFEGMVLLDDIHLNDEMKKWWQEVNANADKWGYKAYELTDVGHFSGTGLLDFSGKVVIEE